MLCDVIADLLTRIRNSLMRKHKFVDVVNSKQVRNVLSTMKKSGFIFDFKESSNKRMIRVYLKYDTKKNPVIQGLKRESSPGRRLYVTKDEIPVVNQNLGIAVVSTSEGIMTGKEARERNLGGELMCKVW